MSKNLFNLFPKISTISPPKKRAYLKPNAA
jgi:hypothetical protein